MSNNKISPVPLTANRPPPTTPPTTASAPTTGSPRKHLAYAHGFDEVVTAQALRYDGRRKVTDTLSRLLDAAQQVDETAQLQPHRTPTGTDRIQGRLFDLTLHRLQKDWHVRCQLHARGLHLQPQESWAATEDMHRVTASTRLPGSDVDPHFYLHSYALHADFGPNWPLTHRNAKRLPSQPWQLQMINGRKGELETVYYGVKVKAATLYDKVAEILKNPQKAYIEAIWAANGWHEGDAVTRFEVRPMRGRGKATHSQDFDGQWRKMVRQACPKPRAPRKREGRIHPAWQPLLSLSFTPPWDAADAPSVILPRARPSDVLVKQNVGLAIHALGYLIAAQPHDQAQIEAIIRTLIASPPLENYRHTCPDMAERFQHKVSRLAEVNGFTGPRSD